MTTLEVKATDLGIGKMILFCGIEMPIVSMDFEMARLVIKTPNGHNKTVEFESLSRAFVSCKSLM